MQTAMIRKMRLQEFLVPGKELQFHPKRSSVRSEQKREIWLSIAAELSLAQGAPLLGLTGRLSKKKPPNYPAPSIANVAYHQFATMLGLRGLYVTRPETLACAWQDAFSTDRPVLLEVRTAPEVSPLPPPISADEA
jgi:hypothetical protein